MIGHEQQGWAEESSFGHSIAAQQCRLRMVGVEGCSLSVSSLPLRRV